MNDMTRWILFGVAAVVVVGLTILRIGMRGGGRSGVYIMIRIVVGLLIVGAAFAWRYWAAQHP